MSGKQFDTEKGVTPPIRTVQAARSNKTRKFVALVCLSTAFYGLYGLSKLWNEVNSPPTVFDLDRGPPPLEEWQKEQIVISVPNGESAHETVKTFASHPHVGGTPQDYIDAKKMLELFQKELGIRPPRHAPIFSAGTPKSRASTIGLTEPIRSPWPTAWIDVYYPSLDTPGGRSLELLDGDGNNVWTADLNEDGDPLDKEAHDYKDAVPAWHGFSSNGEAEGQLVYANYGTKEDYDELVEAGVDLTGKIVVVRYGDTFRGLKLKGAEELGAAGVLIFSDPRDDGYVTVENGYKPYPHGPARNPTSIQRGSVMILSKYPGDPTTPGTPAYENAERQEPENLAKIPSLPISWQNAQRLLEEIGEIYVNGSAVEGKRKLSGKSSQAKVKLVNHVTYNVQPIWNTMAAIPGHIKDEVIIIGCHRDAWVMGAADPVSGTATLQEVVRSLGELLRKGWKPLRTILIASWDAEEYGLVGSTEYGEDFAEWIGQHAVAYLNVDVSTAGSVLGLYASPSLAHLIRRSAKDVPHPTRAGDTLWDALEDDGPHHGTNGSARVDLEFVESSDKKKAWIKAQGSDSLNHIAPLGSGSDFTVFLQRLGVASSDQGFGSLGYDPVYHYHSIYDSIYWQDNFGDADYKKHVAIAQQIGLLTLRLTDSFIVPINTTQYAYKLNEYADKIETYIKGVSDNFRLDITSLRSSIESLQAASLELDDEKVAAEKNFREALKRLPRFPRRLASRHCNNGFIGGVTRYVSGNGDRAAPSHPFDHVQSWEDFLSEDLDALSLLEFPFPKNPWTDFIKAAKRLTRANKKIIMFERGFLHEGGIKDREWYRHLGVAPGKWLGYGATTFPALTEAIVIDKNLDAARHEVSRLVGLLTALTEQTKP